MEINNIKKDVTKIGLIRKLFSKEIPIYARNLRNSKDGFIENIYNEILTEEWMKVVDNKLEPLKLHEKIYLITEAETLKDLISMLFFEKNCGGNYNNLGHHIIGVSAGEGYLTIDFFEDYLLKKYGAEFEELIQEEIEEFKKENPEGAEDGYISYYSIVLDIMHNPIYPFKKYSDSVDAYGAMMDWIEETELDKERLFKHFGLYTVGLKQSVAQRFLR